ncbi:MAG: DUF4019 domain-containing protein [Nitrospirae bacterium]|nr:DUF4019 domain-containing protein [Nitrospirota bacterium]
MIRIMICMVIFGLIMSGGIVMASDAGKEAAAVSAAEKWLASIDAGKYAESWKEAAELFRNALTQEQWVNSLQAGRKPLGKLISRKVLMKTYKTSLPGAPDGEYVVIQFQTSFENKEASIETVTPLMEKDKKWRVSGYYIK